MTTVDSDENLAIPSAFQCQHSRKIQTSFMRPPKSLSKPTLRLLDKAFIPFLEICLFTYRHLSVCKHVPSRSGHCDWCSVCFICCRMMVSFNLFPAESWHRRSHRSNSGPGPSRPSSTLRYFPAGLQYGLQDAFEKPGHILEARHSRSLKCGKSSKQYQREAWNGRCIDQQCGSKRWWWVLCQERQTHAWHECPGDAAGKYEFFESSEMGNPIRQRRSSHAEKVLTIFSVVILVQCPGIDLETCSSYLFP